MNERIPRKKKRKEKLKKKNEFMNEIKKDLPNVRSQKGWINDKRWRKKILKKKSASTIRRLYVVTPRISQGDMINVSTSYGKFHTSPPSDSSLDGRRAFLAMWLPQVTFKEMKAMTIKAMGSSFFDKHYR